MFISFEGGDGAGKSTQIGRLAAWLREHGHPVVLTREPGGTEMGQTLRSLVLHGQDLDPRTEALLYAADRSHHVATLIRPALARGDVVLTDRYLDSSVAYQGSGRGLTPERIADLNLWATHGLLPDLTVLLDLDPARLASRLTAEPDRLERAGADFHARTRAAFLERAAGEPHRFLVIDAALDADDIAAQVRTSVGQRLQGTPPEEGQ